MLKLNKKIYTYRDENEIEYEIEQSRGDCKIIKVKCDIYTEDEMDNLSMEECTWEESEYVYYKPNIQFQCNVDLTKDIIEYELSKRDRKQKIHMKLNEFANTYYDLDIKRIFI